MQEWRPRPEPVWWVVARVLDLVVRALYRVSVVGAHHVPRDGPALLAANHVSYIDPVVLLVVVHRLGRKVRFLGIREVFDQPVIGWVIRAGRHIPIDKGSRRLSALRQARAALTAGELVLVYPEGTIGGLQRNLGAKAGIGLLAATVDVPLVPIGTDGLERFRLRGVARRTVQVVIGAPVEVSRGSCGRAGYQAVSDDVLRRIAALADEASRLRQSGP